jgi:hypothetical protein
MGVTAVWDDREKTVIRLDIDGRWTVGDLQTAGDAIQAMNIDNHDPISMIIDFKGSNLVPDQIVEYAACIATPHSPRLRRLNIIVLVRAGKVIRALYWAFLKTYGGSGVLSERVLFADTLEEARAILSRQHSRSLAPSRR